jgi:hypothetical protein
MAVSDGCPGIIKALEVELPDVPRQPCTTQRAAERCPCRQGGCRQGSDSHLERAE